MNETWVISSCKDEWDDIYEYQTKEEAIAEGMHQYQEFCDDINTKLFGCPCAEDKPKEFFIGQKVDFIPFVDVDLVIEKLQIIAYDVAGEVSRDYLENVSREHAEILKNELSEVYRQWENKYNYTADFYPVANIEKIEL